MEQLLTDALAAGQAQAPVKQVEGFEPFTVIPDGYRLSALSDLRLNPARISQQVKVFDADSFIKYFTDYAQPDSRIFVDVQKPASFGVIDYHELNGAPHWGSHKVIFEFRNTREWATWTGASKKEMPQASFAQFIEDNLPDICEPDPLNIMEAARTLRVKKDINFSSSIRLENGEVQFQYEEELRGTVSRGTVEFPEKFYLKICPFEPGLPPYPEGSIYKVEVRLRYRLRENALTLWYELVRPHKIIEDAVTQIILKIRQGVVNPITLGSF